MSRQTDCQLRLIAEGRCRYGRQHAQPRDGLVTCDACIGRISGYVRAARERAKKRRKK